MILQCVNVQNYEIAERNVIKDAILEIVINLSVNAWVMAAIHLNDTHLTL